MDPYARPPMEILSASNCWWVVVVFLGTPSKARPHTMTHPFVPMSPHLLSPDYLDGMLAKDNLRFRLRPRVNSTQVPKNQKPIARGANPAGHIVRCSYVGGSFFDGSPLSVV